MNPICVWPVCMQRAIKKERISKPHNKKNMTLETKGVFFTDVQLTMNLPTMCFIKSCIHNLSTPRSLGGRVHVLAFYPTVVSYTAK